MIGYLTFHSSSSVAWLSDVSETLYLSWTSSAQLLKLADALHLSQKSPKKVLNIFNHCSKASHNRQSFFFSHYVYVRLHCLKVVILCPHRNPPSALNGCLRPPPGSRTMLSSSYPKLRWSCFDFKIPKCFKVSHQELP